MALPPNRAAVSAQLDEVVLDKLVELHARCGDWCQAHDPPVANIPQQLAGSAIA
jgi:hypothetical protein